MEPHEVGILCDAAICPKRLEGKTRICPECIEHICYLVGDALGTDLCDLCPAGERRDICEHVCGAIIPPGCTEAREGRHDVASIILVCLLDQAFKLVRAFDQMRLILQSGDDGPV